MKKAKYICLAVLVFSFIAGNAQDCEKLVKRIDSLETITDVNIKRNELFAISNTLKDWPLSDIYELGNKTKQLNIIKSEDEKLCIIAFASSTYNGVCQLEWMIDYNRGRWLFRDELPCNTDKGTPILSYSFDYSDAGLYAFTVKNGKKTILKANDIVTKCLFEHLRELKTDAEKDALNKIILSRLSVLWSDADLYNNAFSQLKRMKTLHSDNRKVKICTYNVQKADFKHRFYGAVIIKDKGIKVNRLSDNAENIRSPENTSLTGKKWYGALYLDLIETVRGSKTYYTLLGYGGHDEFMKTRVLDVLTVQNGRLRFGSPVFKTGHMTRNRVIFQYSAGVAMMMRYDAKQKMIVFDNLAPADPMFSGVYQYYGPDFSYNAFQLTKGVWELKKDIDLRNPKE